ncbi:MAG: DinB family protein [Schlesneria sp.]
MSFCQTIHTEAVEDILLLELRPGVSSLADQNVLNELESIRNLRREIGCHKLIIDLKEAPFFGSSLLELIRVLWNDVSTDGGRLVLCNPSPVGREVLAVSKFDRLWPMTDSRAKALALLGAASNVTTWPMNLQELIAKYDHGPTQLRDAISGLSSIQLRIPAPPGAWSVLQIVCHIADFELVYADRMKRVVAEDRPTLFGGDPDVFAAKLAYSQRNLEEELDVIMSVRREVSRFLKTLSPDDFERTGQHSADGPLSLMRLLERIAGHIPHHVDFIERKKKTLQKPQADSK